jgi:putative transposase
MRMKEITDTRVHYGYRRVHVMLRREGRQDNVKRMYRLYREEGLSLRLKRPRARELQRPPASGVSGGNGNGDLRCQGGRFM